MKPGYKQTDVGVIPEEWEVKTFREIGKLTKGKGLLKEDIKRIGSIPAIPYTALYTDFSEVLNYCDIKWFIDDEIQSVIVREPCVLLASSSNMEANTGKASALVGTAPVAIGREVIVFKTSSDCKFISYLLSTPTYRKKTLTLARGTTIKHLYPATFQNYQIALPSLPEQRAIAAALSDMDALLTALDRLIAKKRDIKQAAMQQLLTGQTRLPGFKDEWTMKRLGDVGTFLKGSGVKKDESNSGALPCIRYGEIYTRHNDYIKEFHSFISIKVAATACLLKKGDLLFAGSGETKEEIGKCVAFLDDLESYAGGDIVILRPQGVDSLYLGYSLNTSPINRQKASRGQGDAVVHIGSSALAGVSLNLPPLPEQTAIATVLSDMDLELAALEQRRDKTCALKQGMMQELLTARTRLV
jgi:type I restriction enzyme, S subunit